MNDLVLKSIDKIVSGDIEKGILPGDTIVVRDGKIAAIGYEKDVDTSGIETVVDVDGQIVCPGFIDCHVHNTLDDYAPQRGAVGCYADALYAGTTSMVSEGEQGPGWPRFYDDAIGCKAAAIMAKRVFDRFRPGGALKFHGGALVLVHGLTEQDFKEMHDAGVWLIAEIGGGGLSDPAEVAPMLEWARKYNFFYSVHLAPPSIPGSSWVTSEEILKLRPNKVAHTNGGSTAVSYDHIERLMDESDIPLELVVNGNFVNFNKMMRHMDRKNQLHRMVFGSDAPHGPGVPVRRHQPRHRQGVRPQRRAGLEVHRHGHRQRRRPVRPEHRQDRGGPRGRPAGHRLPARLLRLRRPEGHRARRPVRQLHGHRRRPDHRLPRQGLPAHGPVLLRQRPEGLRLRHHRAPVLPAAARPPL